MKPFRRKTDKVLKLVVIASIAMAAGSVLAGLVSTVFGWQEGVPVFVATFIVVAYELYKGVFK